MVGIDIYDIEKDIDRTIYRLTARIPLADAVLNGLVDEELEYGRNLTKKNIQQYVYALPQGANTRYKRTYNLLNAVTAGKIRSGGSVVSGQVYITREKFHRVYYPVFVEHGEDAGAPYEGRHFWAITVAQLKIDARKKAIMAGRVVARGK